MSSEELAGNVWGDDPLLAVKDVGFYIRTLLPVKLTAARLASELRSATAPLS